MTLEQMEELRNLSSLDILYKLIDLAENSTKDAEKTLKGVKKAGVRLRKNMQDIKLLSDVIRDKVQMTKGAEWGEKRKFSLDKAIEIEKKRLQKEDERIEKARQKRLQELNM